MTKTLMRIATVLSLAALPAFAGCSSLIEPEPPSATPIVGVHEDPDSESRCDPHDEANSCYQI